MYSKSVFRSCDAAILVSSPSSTEKEDGTVTAQHTELFDTQDSNLDSVYDNNSSSTAKNPLARLLESSFLGMTRKDHVVEEELKDIVKIAPSQNSNHSVDDFDVCKEYSYSDDEDDQGYFQNQSTSPSAKSREEVLLIYILGKGYHPITDYAVRRDDESSLFWFTYRCDFPEIAPYGITSDAGWGCMLRSAMMLLSQALRVHFQGRNWRPPTQLQRRRLDPFVRSLLTWFADFPSSESNFYSLHNMVAAGLNRQVLPGEWYGPGTACHVLKDLVELHERHQKQSKTAGMVDRRIFRVHVASDASVYKNIIEGLMTRDSKAYLQTERERLEANSKPSHPLDTAWECELIELETGIEWDTSLVLLIPLRLGLKTFNPQYAQTLAHIFSLPQSLGVLGGRPRGARWFYGAVADGSKIFGLDPHTVQTAPRKRTACVNGVPSLIVDLSDEYLRSVHTTFPETFPLSKMDPSIALGFYLKDRGDFANLLSSIDQWSKSHPDQPELFSIFASAPDYSTNFSTVMDGMLSGHMSGSILDDDASAGSEEDDYVVL